MHHWLNFSKVPLYLEYSIKIWTVLNSTILRSSMGLKEVLHSSSFWLSSLSLVILRPSMGSLNFFMWFLGLPWYYQNLYDATTRILHNATPRIVHVTLKSSISTPNFSMVFKLFRRFFELFVGFSCWSFESPLNSSWV